MRGSMGIPKRQEVKNMAQEISDRSIAIAVIRTALYSINTMSEVIIAEGDDGLLEILVDDIEDAQEELDKTFLLARIER